MDPKSFAFCLFRHFIGVLNEAVDLASDVKLIECKASCDGICWRGVIKRRKE
jgi:hypothetical protein